MRIFALLLSLILSLSPLLSEVHDNQNSVSVDSLFIKIKRHFPDLLSVEIVDNKLFAGTENGVLVSTDKGDSWLTPDEDGIDNMAKLKINYIKLINRLLYACSDSGIYISNDYGESWTKKVSHLDITCIESDDKYNIFFGVKDRYAGVYLLKKEDIVWLQGTRYYDANCLLFESGILYAGTENGLIRSADNGNTWQLISCSLNIISIRIIDNTIYIDTKYDGIYKAHKDELFRTSSESHIFPQKVNKTSFDTVPCIEDEPYYTYTGKGSGTIEDPYQITNIKEFQEISYDYSGEHFWILMNDIDASETRYWNQIVYGNDTVYNGFIRISGKNVNTIDGQGHIIQNLYSSGSSNIFENINCMKLRRIGFENILIEPNVSTKTFIHQMDNDLEVEIEECFVTGRFKEKATGDSWAIGFGIFFTNTKVKNCYSDIKVSGSKNNYQFGSVYDDASITNSYATGTSSADNILSPFGYSGNVVSCFWDADKIKVTNDSLGLGLGLSTAEMMKRTTFESAGWDFENVWYIEEGMDYPKLKCFRDGVGVEEKEPVKSGIAEMLITGNSDKIKIDYSLPIPGQVRIKIFNSLGALEGVIFEGFSQFSDSGSTQFDASALPSGMYFITLESSGIRLCKQYALIK